MEVKKVVEMSSYFFIIAAHFLSLKNRKKALCIGLFWGKIILDVLCAIRPETSEENR